MAASIDSFSTANFATLREREERLDEAESIRLMYVAATRARDHLVLSTFRRRRAESSPAARLLQNLRDFSSVQKLHFPPENQVKRAIPVPTPPDELELASAMAEEKHWLERRQQLIAQHRAQDVVSVTALALATHEDFAFNVGRGKPDGTALGRAVHAALEVVDFQELTNLPALARFYAEMENIPERAAQVELFVQSACNSAAVRRAQQAADYWREVPVSGLINGRIIEGFIDLVYTEGNEIVIVDYKTDQIEESEVGQRLERYRDQGAWYALLVGEALKKPVARVEFVFVAIGETHALADVQSLCHTLRQSL